MELENPTEMVLLEGQKEGRATSYVQMDDDDVPRRAQPLSSAGPVRGLSKREKAMRYLGTTLAEVTGEFIGTFILTLAICTAVNNSLITGALLGLGQVAAVFGLGVALSVYCTAYFSKAHLNPAVTLAFAIVRFRTFPLGKVAPYVAAQMLGGFCAGGVLYGLYRHAIEDFESDNGIQRGEDGSELSASVLGEYFPNPSVYNHATDSDVISVTEALFTEAWATGVLVFVIFSLTSPQNCAVGSGKHRAAVPALIGVTIAFLLSLYAPLTQAGMNPARDFGPRLFSVLVGWGKIAIPGPRGGFWVYIVGPIIGAPIGGAVYDWLVVPAVRFAELVQK